MFIDVGTNEGKVLQQMLNVAPNNQHFAFEPIPVLYHQLVKKFSQKVRLHNIALSNTSGEANFNLVLSDMAYSGLNKRVYDKKEKDTTIIVHTEKLDSLIPNSIKISLIKIDVEGAEMLVLLGAIDTINNSKPLILFEFGKAGSQAYDVTNHQMFIFFKEELN